MGGVSTTRMPASLLGQGELVKRQTYVMAARGGQLTPLYVPRRQIDQNQQGMVWQQSHSNLETANMFQFPTTNAAIAQKLVFVANGSESLACIEFWEPRVCLQENFNIFSPSSPPSNGARAQRSPTAELRSCQHP